MIRALAGWVTLLVATATLVEAGAGAGAGTVEVRDMLGRRIAVPERATRVVSLAPSMTEIVYALGAADRLVGVTEHCDFPKEAATKPKVGGFYTPNFEVLLTVKPDLILATSIEGGREETVRGIEAFRIPVYVVRPLDFATVLESIERLGRLLDRGTEAARLVDSMRRQADGIARALHGARRPRVLYVLWGNPLIVPGRDTLITDLIRRAGGDSVTGAEPLVYPRFSVEEAVARRPERVVLAQQGEATVDQRLREWPHLTLLPAVRQGRIHPVDGDLIHRPGPRIVEGLQALARLFHPDIAP